MHVLWEYPCRTRLVWVNTLTNISQNDILIQHHHTVCLTHLQCHMRSRVPRTRLRMSKHSYKHFRKWYRFTIHKTIHLTHLQCHTHVHTTCWNIASYTQELISIKIPTSLDLLCTWNDLNIPNIDTISLTDHDISISVLPLVDFANIMFIIILIPYEQLNWCKLATSFWTMW